MNDTTRQILEQMATGRIPDDIPDAADYADTLRRLVHYFAAIQHFTVALSNGDLSQSLEGVTGPVVDGLKSLQSGLRHLTWQTNQVAVGDFSQSVDLMGDLSSAFNTMVADLSAAHEQFTLANQELSREIDARKEAEREIEFKNAILSTQQETTIDGILVVDEGNAIISYNRRFTEMWGIPRALVEAGDDAPVLQFVTTLVADEGGFLAMVKYLYEHKKGISQEEILLKDGRVFDRYSAPIRRADGKYLGRVWYFRDITERKHIEKMLSKQAHTDQMTGVNNRGYFLELLDVEIERASRYGRPLCVLMLDLDHFKSINDTHGHATGDEAIRTVPRVIQATGLRQSDFLGRIGGEEFAVALPETDLRDAADAAERVCSQLAGTLVSYASKNFSITVSIGVCEYKDGDSQETLLQRADQAMYKAKQTGRNRVCLAS